VITRVEKITRSVIENARGLQVIGQHGVGVENIDVKAATDKGILVINVPTVNFVSVAEHVIMLMLALSRKIAESDAAVRKGDFLFRERFFPIEMNGKILFAVGLGRIGSEVSKKCRIGFNMRCLAYDPYISETEMKANGVEKTTLESGLSMADYISIHLPLTNETKQLIGEKEISLIKPTAFLINVSRGGVINQAALVHALKKSQINGAGLDVFEPEPPSIDDPVLGLPNVILSPHFAGDTYEAKQRCSATLANEVVRVLNCNFPKFPVNPEVFFMENTNLKMQQNL
jgi:D-3-phosphoglycerate dehydrogenase